MQEARGMISEFPCPKVSSRTAKMQVRLDSYLKLVSQLARIIWWMLDQETNPFTVHILTKTDSAGVRTTVMIIWISKVSIALKMAFSTRLPHRFTPDRARTSTHSTTLKAQVSYHTKLRLPRSKVPAFKQTRGRRDTTNESKNQTTWRRSSKNGALRTRRPSACSSFVSESRTLERRRREREDQAKPAADSDMTSWWI